MEHRRLRAVLVEHGLTPAADAMIGRQLRRLVRLTRERNREHAVLVEADTGAQVGDLLVGERTSIDLAPHIRAMQRDRSYVSIHTHPSDCSFSRPDATLLFREPRLRALVVVGVRGTVYLLSRLGLLPSSDVLVAAHAAAVEHHRPVYELAVVGGEMSRRSAEYRRGDAVWRDVAGACGLRYTRIELEVGS